MVAILRESSLTEDPILFLHFDFKVLHLKERFGLLAESLLLEFIWHHSEFVFNPEKDGQVARHQGKLYFIYGLLLSMPSF
jgi:hypothetical protein